VPALPPSRRYHCYNITFTTNGNAATTATNAAKTEIATIVTMATIALLVLLLQFWLWRCCIGIELTLSFNLGAATPIHIADVPWGVQKRFPECGHEPHIFSTRCLHAHLL
jgi:hypothetical protein